LEYFVVSLLLEMSVLIKFLQELTSQAGFQDMLMSNIQRLKQPKKYVMKMSSARESLKDTQLSLLTNGIMELMLFLFSHFEVQLPLSIINLVFSSERFPISSKHALLVTTLWLMEHTCQAVLINARITRLLKVLRQLADRLHLVEVWLYRKNTLEDRRVQILFKENSDSNLEQYLKLMLPLPKKTPGWRWHALLDIELFACW